MADIRDSVPAYQTIQIGVLESPVAQLTDAEEWEARARYPSISSAGGALFYCARESEQGGWEVLPRSGGDDPQEARDNLASCFREAASNAEQAGDEETRAEAMRAAELLDWEPLDEVAALGTRYRVIRAEPFTRSGPDGPEPPRPGDPDPGEPDESHGVPDAAFGLRIDPAAVSGMATGILRGELLNLGPKPGDPDDAVIAGEAARHSHPGIILLPPVYMIVTRTAHGWTPSWRATWSNPQSARDFLADEIRDRIPFREQLPEPAAKALRLAADRFQEQRVNELGFRDQLHRVIRVARIVRVGPDGPEGPRPSDESQYPPSARHHQDLVSAGQIPAEEDEDAPVELTEEDNRYWAAAQESAARRAERIARRKSVAAARRAQAARKNRGKGKGRH